MDDYERNRTDHYSRDDSDMRRMERQRDDWNSHDSRLSENDYDDRLRRHGQERNTKDNQGYFPKEIMLSLRQERIARYVVGVGVVFIFGIVIINLLGFNLNVFQ